MAVIQLANTCGAAIGGVALDHLGLLSPLVISGALMLLTGLLVAVKVRVVGTAFSRTRQPGQVRDAAREQAVKSMGVRLCQTGVNIGNHFRQVGQRINHIIAPPRHTVCLLHSLAAGGDLSPSSLPDILPRWRQTRCRTPPGRRSTCRRSALR